MRLSVSLGIQLNVHAVLTPSVFEIDSIKHVFVKACGDTLEKVALHIVRNSEISPPVLPLHDGGQEMS